MSALQPHNHLEDFEALPWCRALLNSPEVQNFTHPLPPPPHHPYVPNALWSATLPGATRLRAWTWLKCRRPGLTSSIAPGFTSRGPLSALPAAGPEAFLLVSLAPGLSGYVDKLHGGMFGVLIDQVGGICGVSTIREDFMTVEITLRFKRVIPLPSVVLCRAVCRRLEGRKMWIEASLEDGEGEVYCEADTFWLVTDKGSGPGSKI